MELGLDKCATAVLKHSKPNKSHNISVNNRTVISNMALDEPYKYLGIEEGDDGTDNSQMKDKLLKEFLMLHRACCLTCFIIQFMHYLQYKIHSL
jgi:hypothetical protein